MTESTKLTNDLLASLGGVLGMEGLVLDEDGYCSLAIEDSLVVTIRHDPAGDKLTISAELGHITHERKPALFKTMLESNYAWRATSGIGTLSLLPDQSDDVPAIAVMMHQVPAQSLNDWSFQTLFEAFLGTAEAWSGYLRSLDQSAATDVPGDAWTPESGAMPGMIRV